MRKALFPSFLILAALPAFAADLTPELQAKIQRDQAAAIDKVNAAHGNKKPSEMDSLERRDVAKEQAQAQQEVIDKAGVDTKSFARYSAKMSLDDRKRAADETKRLDTEAAAAAAKEKDKTTAGAAGNPQGPAAAGGVIIEKGTPEAKNAAAAAERASSSDAAPDTKKKKKHRRGRDSDG